MVKAGSVFPIGGSISLATVWEEEDRLRRRKMGEKEEEVKVATMEGKRRDLIAEG